MTDAGHDDDVRVRQQLLQQLRRRRVDHPVVGAEDDQRRSAKPIDAAFDRIGSRLALGLAVVAAALDRILGVFSPRAITIPARGLP